MGDVRSTGGQQGTQVLAVRKVRARVARSRSGSFLDGLGDDHVVMTSDKEAQRKVIRNIEDNVLKKALFIVDAALSFQEIDPAKPKEIPRTWVDELGLDVAKERHRVALESWRNQKECAVGLKIGQMTAMGIIKARAAEKAADRPLNIGVLMMAPMRDYKTQDVEK